MKHESDSFKDNLSTHSLIGLFAFVCGALLTLLYFRSVRLSADREVFLLAVSFLVLLDSVLASSVCGQAAAPLLNLLCGVMCALTAVKSLEDSSYIGVLFTLFPMLFALCVFSAYISGKIGSALKNKCALRKRDYLLVYSFIVIASAQFALSLVMMFR